MNEAKTLKNLICHGVVHTYLLLNTVIISYHLMSPNSQAM